ncbi:MAG: hypothetical protein BGN89_04000 [Alphaproteobacteria bacterium 64-6]|nr:MAG: hypothetical protein BGN89_04000 [Alphaproteobacteria bacterium 64-6]
MNADIRWTAKLDEHVRAAESRGFDSRAQGVGAVVVGYRDSHAFRTDDGVHLVARSHSRT